MRLFDRLSWGKTSAALDALLGPVTGAVVVSGVPELGRVLGERREVVVLGPGDAPPPGAAAVVTAHASDDDPVAVLELVTAPLGNGGRVIVLDRVPRAELARRALCAGLVELEERQLGGRLAVIGRIRRRG